MNAMYKIGTLVLYDKQGVYRIEGVGAPPIRGTTDDYYKLCPVFSNGTGIVYTPVNTVLSMRPLISSGEAIHYLELFAQLEPHIIRSSKTTDLAVHYRDLLSSHKIEDCLLLLKEIYVRQRQMAQLRKPLGQVDARYLKLAEKLICEEFAVVLNTTPDLIRERLCAAMEQEYTA